MQKTIHTPSLTHHKAGSNSANFVIEPLLSGYGMTLGNSIRRVLLSSIVGGAVVAFRVKGATHEFTTLSGVKEDVLEIMLNVKSLRFKILEELNEPQTLSLKQQGPGPVTAKDIAKHPLVEVVDPAQLIASLDSAKDSLDMELIIDTGRGYLTAEDNPDQYPTDFIAVDALFSPVLRVRYKVEDTRIGQQTNLDKLSLTVDTDGSMTPQAAFEDANAILKAHYQELAGATEVEADSFVNANAPEVEANPETTPAELMQQIDELNLSARTANALANNNIQTLADLVNLSDASLKELKGFGVKALDEVKQKLQELEL